MTATPRNKFTIPVFPHVKKFIQKNYQRSGVIRTEEYTTLGKLVTLALRDNREWKYNTGRGPGAHLSTHKLTASIVVQLTKEQSEMIPRIAKLMRINVDMDCEFKAHMISWILAGKQMGHPPFTTCKMFLAFYKIDDKEYSLDAAYKYWQRVSKGQGVNPGQEA